MAKPAPSLLPIFTAGYEGRVQDELFDTLIAAGATVLLDRTRVFRHRERNSYGFDLDAGIVLERAREIIPADNALKADMRRFLSAQPNKP